MIGFTKLCSRIEFFCPQTLCVFCIDQVDGSEVLLKLILGLKKHPYHSSIYLIHIPLHSIFTNSVKATSFRTYEHGSVCSCSVAVVGTVLCTKAVWDTQLRNSGDI